MAFEARSSLLIGRAAAIVGLSIVLQLTVFGQGLLGTPVRLDLPLLIVCAVSLRAEPKDAVVLGFASGLAVDLFQVGPFGQQAFAYTALAYGVSQIAPRRAIGPEAWKRPALRSIVGGAAVGANWLLIFGIGSVVAGSAPWQPLAGVPVASIAGGCVGLPVVAAVVFRLGVVNAGSLRRSSWQPALNSDRRPGLSTP